MKAHSGDTPVKASKQSDKIKAMLESIHNKRAKIVITRILEQGFITTEELEKKYGYNHPPRAARDVREAGIPLETFRVKSSDGRSIAAYRFGDLTKVKNDRLEGRSIFSKESKKKLYTLSAGRCYICNNKFDERYLQIDHRVPYEVSGDNNTPDNSAYSLICGSCNRAKSWTCEHCDNWKTIKDPKRCLNCYWASPTNYNHIALTPSRRIELVWNDKEVSAFEFLEQEAAKQHIDIREYVKRLLKGEIEKQ